MRHAFCDEVPIIFIPEPFGEYAILAVFMLIFLRRSFGFQRRR